MANPKLALWAALVFLPSMAFSQSRVGIMNAQKSVVDTAEFKFEAANIATRNKAGKDRLEQMRKELSKLKTQRNTTLADEAATVSQVDRMQIRVEQFERNMQADIGRERNEALQRIRLRMAEVIRKIMDERGLDGVINSTSAILFKPDLDITGEATAAYDKMYPVK